MKGEEVEGERNAREAQGPHEVETGGFEHVGFWRLVDRELEDLPDHYGETRVVLLPVEPCLAYVYWEIAPESLIPEALRSSTLSVGDEPPGLELILRFYEATDLESSGAAAREYLDVLIRRQAGSEYVPLCGPGSAYFAELGLMSREKGTVFPIARSNVVTMPRVGPLPAVRERLVPVSEDHDLVETPSARVDADAVQGPETHIPDSRAAERPGIETRESRIEPTREEPNPVVAESGDVEICPSDATRIVSPDWEPIATHPATSAFTDPFCEGKARPDQDSAGRPTDGVEILRKKLAVLYKFRMKQVLPSKPEDRAALDIAQHQYEEDRDLDLTEISEKRFTAGISSGPVEQDR